MDLHELEQMLTQANLLETSSKLARINDSLIQADFERELQQHDAVMSIAENSEKTAQNVDEMRDTVTGIDNRIALLNRRVEELSQDVRTEKERAEYAEQKLAKKDRWFQIWLVILSAALTPDFIKLISKAVQALLKWLS